MDRLDHQVFHDAMREQRVLMDDRVAHAAVKIGRLEAEGLQEDALAAMGLRLAFKSGQ